jgi:hypothetical protein
MELHKFFRIVISIRIQKLYVVPEEENCIDQLVTSNKILISIQNNLFM